MRTLLAILFGAAVGLGLFPYREPTIKRIVRGRRAIAHETPMSDSPAHGPDPGF